MAPAQKREYGRAYLKRRGESPLFASLPEEFQVWMSHGDHVETPPADFQIAATGPTISAIQHQALPLYGIQFHPEVAHTEHGARILENFLFGICRCSADWSMGSFVEVAVAKIRTQLSDDGHAVCALSGGVGSTVAALLVDRAVGERLTCIFVDNGLLRKDEYQQVIKRFRDKLHLNVVAVQAVKDRPSTRARS